jgi:hypothetical protein
MTQSIIIMSLTVAISCLAVRDAVVRYLSTLEVSE